MYAPRLTLAGTLTALLGLVGAFDPEEECRKIDGPCLLTQKYCGNYGGLQGCSFPDDTTVLTSGAVQRAVFYTETDYTIKWTGTNDKYPTLISWYLGVKPVQYNVSAGKKEYTFRFEDVAALNGSKTDIGYWQALVHGFDDFGNQINIGQPEDPAYKDEPLGGSFLDLSTEFVLMPAAVMGSVEKLAPDAVHDVVHKWKLGVGIGVGVGVPILMLLSFVVGWKMPKKGSKAKKIESM